MRIVVLGDVRAVEGDGTAREVLRDAGVKDAKLLIACSAHEEANLVCAMIVKRLSSALAIMRTTSVEYLEAWREKRDRRKMGLAGPPAADRQQCIGIRLPAIEIQPA